MGTILDRLDDKEKKKAHGERRIILTPAKRDNGTNGAVQEHVSTESAFHVIVECKDEREQRKVYEDLTEKGFECRVLTL